MKNPYKRLVKDPYKRRIERLIHPILDKVPQEIKTNTMGGVSPKSFFWRPNNYRLQFIFNTERFKRNTTLNSGVTISNFGTKYSLKNYNETTIVLDIPKHKKQAKATIIYKPKKRFYYEVKYTSLKAIDKRINEKVLIIEKKLLYALNRFILRFGGSIDLNSKKWVRFEDDIHGEDYIDKIPRDMLINDTYFKKAYQTGLEFKSPAYMKTYISNRTVEEIAPEIAEAINGLGNSFTAFTSQALPTIQQLSANMGTHVKIMKDIGKGINKFNNTVEKLNEKLDQKKLNEWLK